MSDREIQLMLRIREGDSRAFEELYLLYRKPLANYFHRLCWNSARVDDLVQEVFLRLWKAAPRYEPVAKFSTYLFRIAHNLWINDSRKRRESALKETEGEQENPPDRSLERTELQRRIQAAIETLPEREQECLVLSQYNGLKYAEIAEVMGIPVGTVKSRIFSAIRRLRTELGPE